MKYYKIRSDSLHWCGCWNEVYVEVFTQEQLEWEIYDNEEYVRIELIDSIDEEDDDWFEDYDMVSSIVEEVDYDEYLRNKD